jgi:DNA polymerase-3 subunit delta'
MAVSLGQPPRYFPGEDRALSSLAAAVGWAGAEQWSRVLRRMVQSAEHPLNAKLTIEEAMIAYAAALTP